MTPCPHPVVTLWCASDSLSTHQDQDRDLYRDLRPDQIGEGKAASTSQRGLGGKGAKTNRQRTTIEGNGPFSKANRAIGKSNGKGTEIHHFRTFF